LDFRNVDLYGERKTEEPGENPSKGENRQTTQLMMQSPGVSLPVILTMLPIEWILYDCEKLTVQSLTSLSHHMIVLADFLIAMQCAVGFHTY
jgi:hypothetical protein